MSGTKDQAPWFVDEETDQFLAGLDLSMPADEPPAKLWTRIAGSLVPAQAADGRLDEQARHNFSPARQGRAREGLDVANVQARLGEGRWREFAPGVTFKRLWTRDTYLLRCEPGSEIPDHEHPTFEHTVVVSGDLVIDDVTYGPGDYLGTPKGGTHPNWTTKSGCIVLVHYEAA